MSIPKWATIASNVLEALETPNTREVVEVPSTGVSIIDRTGYPMELKLNKFDEVIPQWIPGYGCSTQYYPYTPKPYGYTCIKCIDRGDSKQEISYESWRLNEEQLHTFVHSAPIRCRKCEGHKSRNTRARNKIMDLVALCDNDPSLRLKRMDLTRKSWNLIIPEETYDEIRRPIIMDLKKRSIKDYNNHRQRSELWKSKMMSGQYYPEITVKAKLSKCGAMIGQVLHFHVHCVVASKYLECQEKDDYKFAKDWGGRIHVYEIDHTDKESLKDCINYVSKYISKSDFQSWKSVPFGEWMKK